MASIIKRVKPRRIRVLPFVPPGPHDSPGGQTLRSKTKLLVVADLYPHKGIEDAILAVEHLSEVIPGIELDVCGRQMDDGYGQKLRSLVRSGHVRFIGPKERLEAIRLIARARGLVHCSRVESLGRNLLEAMHQGTPILAADLPVTREVCGDAAWYYRQGDVEGLAGLIADLLKDEDVAHELGDRGLKRMEGREWIDAPGAVLEGLLGRRAGDL
jgi:glycosyltransferase involved in cell wall biosynthesis